MQRMVGVTRTPVVHRHLTLYIVMMQSACRVCPSQTFKTCHLCIGCHHAFKLVLSGMCAWLVPREGADARAPPGSCKNRHQSPLMNDNAICGAMHGQTRKATVVVSWYCLTGTLQTASLLDPARLEASAGGSSPRLSPMQMVMLASACISSVKVTYS